MKLEKKDESFIQQAKIIVATQKQYDFLMQYDWTSLKEDFIRRHFSPEERDKTYYCQHYLTKYPDVFSTETYDLNAIDVAVKRLTDSFPPGI